MFVAAAPLSAFINARPSLIILCLGFLLMIGLVLVADGLGVHVPKGYVYAAIAFSALIETFNQVAMRNRRKLAATIPPRQRMAHAVLRMLGGVPLPGPGALAVEAAGSVPADAPAADVFAPLERRMVRSVLELARRPVTAIMTHRADVQWIDAAAGRDAVLGKLRASPYRGFPVGHGSIDQLLGVVRKDDVLSLYLHDKPFELEQVISEAIAMPASITVYDALERFKGAPLELAIVADEYGGVAGVVTDEPPEIEPLPDGAYSLDGALPLPDLQERLHFDTLPEGRYQTAAGLVLAILGRVPRQGDTVQWGGWTLEVAAMDRLSVKRLVARRVAPPSDADRP
jgi:CBS domain containing-hemolysin-like protein